MRYKRSLLTVFFICLLMFVFVACNKSNSEDETKTEEGGKKETKKKSKKDKDKKKETEEKEQKEVSEKPHVSLDITELIHDDKESEDDADYDYLYKLTSFHLHLDNDSEEFKPLAEAFDKYNEEVDKITADARQELEQYVEEIRSDQPDYFSKKGMLTDETEAYVIRADKSIVSVVSLRTMDYGGVHPGYAYSSCNYDTGTGKELKFTDVVKDTKAFFEILDEKVDEEYPYDNLEKPSTYAKELEGGDYKDLVWTVNAEGVSVYFNTYILGPYSAGSQIISVYFDEADKMFNDRYVNKEEDYIFPVMVGNMFMSLDTDGDGEREPVHVQGIYEKVYEDNDIYNTGLEVFVGEESVRAYGYSGSAYLIRKDGKYYMYLFLGQDNDSEVLSRVDLDAMNYSMTDDIYDIRLPYGGSEAVQKDNEYIYTNLRPALTDTESFIGETRGEVLSTFSGSKEWRIGKNAVPEAKEERYRVSSDHIIHCLKDISCEEVDEKGNVKQEATIPSDSYLLFIYSDTQSFVDVRIIDEKDVEKETWGDYGMGYNLKDKSLKDYKGPCYRITVDLDKEDWERSVDGERIDELFEGMLFAG